MVTILHFHLIDPIMMGNKKTKDVQFYAEVGAGVGGGEKLCEKAFVGGT